MSTEPGGRFCTSVIFVAGAGAFGCGFFRKARGRVYWGHVEE